MVDDLLSKDLVQESLSPYAAYALLVLKKDGSIRMCVNNKAINKNAIKYRFPIPRMENMLDKVQDTIRLGDE